MSLTRRAFFDSLGRGGTGALSSAFLIGARGLEALEGEGVMPAPLQPGEIRISSNENPLGPGMKVVEAVRENFDQCGRYPFNSRITDSQLMNTMAEVHGGTRRNILLGAGSGEILTNSVRVFTSPERPLVTGEPSYGSPVGAARQFGTPVKAVPVDTSLRLDLDGMARAARGAGLVFLCNPNNPTGTAHTGLAVANFIDRVKTDSPETAILVDEAYCDYVTDPSYESMVSLALGTPGVFVCRTFSKAHGMAGLRAGYAVGHADAISELNRWRLTFNVNTLTVVACETSLRNLDRIDQECARNAEVRKFTMDFFTNAGYKCTDSQTNFIFVDLGRPAKEFRDACARQNVRIGRDFPPMEQTHSRISMGTMDEMRTAVGVFADILGVSATNSG
jgi:histidinol-phosphate aminotransferase